MRRIVALAIAVGVALLVASGGAGQASARFIPPSKAGTAVSARYIPPSR